MAYLPWRAALRRVTGSGVFKRLRCALDHYIASESLQVMDPEDDHHASRQLPANLFLGGRSGSFVPEAIPL